MIRNLGENRRNGYERKVGVGGVRKSHPTSADRRAGTTYKDEGSLMPSFNDQELFLMQ